MKNLVAFLAGTVFAIGLAVSGMTKPSKVLGFLDLGGSWDPSLAFVMMGAVGVHAVLYRFVLRRGHPLFDTRFHVPPPRAVDRRLAIGAALFGIGWGIAGFCPGPALVSAAGGSSTAIAFVAAMVVGMLLEKAVRPRAPA